MIFRITISLILCACCLDISCMAMNSKNHKSKPCEGCKVSITLKGNRLKHGSHVKVYETAVDIRDPKITAQGELTDILLSLPDQQIQDHTYSYRTENLIYPELLSFSMTDLEGGLIRTNRFVVEPGDSVLMHIDSTGFRFEGNNAGKYAFQLKMENELAVAERLANNDSEPWGSRLFRIDSIGIMLMKELSKAKNDMKESSYLLMKGQIVIGSLSIISNKMRLDARNNSEIVKQSLSVKNYRELWNNEIKTGLEKSKELLYNMQYLSFIPGQYELDSVFFLNREFNVINYYKYLTSVYSGKPFDTLVYMLIAKHQNKAQSDLVYCVNDALDNERISSKEIKAYLKKLRKNNFPGVTAYPFALTDAAGKIVKLSDFKGKVILMDFWYIGCGPCAGLHPKLDSIRQLFKDRPFELVTVCTEEAGKSIDAWRKALETKKYTSPESINLWVNNGKGTGDNIIKHYSITGCPYLILIDKDGNLAPLSNFYSGTPLERDKGVVGSINKCL